MRPEVKKQQLLDVWASKQQQQQQQNNSTTSGQLKQTRQTNPNSPLGQQQRQQQQKPPIDSSNAWHWLHYHTNKPAATFNDYYQQLTTDFDADHQSNLIHRRRPNDANSTLQTAATKLTQLKHYDHLAQLSCDSGEMILRLNFTEAFKGVVYPDHNRVSACRFFGDGHHNYELRLPLRGCGTRQVAPRIFVNDVIVRFHKTLELEEDEVKTLICRYPPPLAATSGISTGAGGTNSAGFQNARPHEQFELLDQFNIIRTPPPPPPPPPPPTTGSSSSGSSGASGKTLANSGHYSQVPGTVEVLSESSLVAPSTGSAANQHRRPQTLFDLDRQRNELLLFNARQRNANIVAANSNSPPELSSGPTGGIILPAGVQEINQPTANKGTFLDRLTSLELLFLVSSLMFLVLLALGLLGTYLCFRRRRPPSAGAILSGRKRAGRPRGYLGPTVARAAFQGADIGAHQLRQHHQRQQQHNYGIPTTGGSFYAAHLAAAQHHHQQQQQQQQHYHHHQQHHQHHQTAPASSSSPESDLSQQVLLPAGGANSQRHHSARPTFVGLGDTGQKYQHPSQAPQPPVLGRRDAALYAYAKPNGNANNANNGNTNHQLASLGRNRNKSHQLLLMSSSAGPGQHYQQPSNIRQPGEGYQSRHSNATMARASAREPLLKLAGGPEVIDELPGKMTTTTTTTTTTPRRQTVRRVANPLDFDHHNYHRAALSRAKSLQQLQEGPGDSPTMGPLDGWQSLSRAPPVEGDRATSSAARPRQMARTSSAARGAPLAAPKPLLFRREHRLDDWRRVASSPSSSPTSSSSSSDTEVELNNNLQGGAAQAEQRPRLYLQSIEDSFITNVTEIHEQEYLKRDSRMPLSWAQWRSKQPVESATRRSEQEQEPEQEPEFTWNQTNLRSLTELDVNFAKSLLLGSPSKQQQQQQQQQQQVAEGAPKQRGEGAEDNKNLVPSSATGGQAAKLVQPSTEGQPGKESGQSADLVISADYEMGRLKLASSPSSQASISYV